MIKIKVPVFHGVGMNPARFQREDEARVRPASVDAILPGEAVLTKLLDCRQAAHGKDLDRNTLSVLLIGGKEVFAVGSVAQLEKSIYGEPETDGQ